MPDHTNATGPCQPPPYCSATMHPRAITPAAPPPGTTRFRKLRGALAAALAGTALLASATDASASLIGAHVTYQYLFPTTQSVLDAGGPQTVTPLTAFTDSQNGLTSFFIGNHLVVENTSPLAFAATTFNGPQFSFAAGGLTAAAVDPTSSPDFIGTVTSTNSVVQTNFSALTPALGSTMTVDLATSALLTGQQAGYKYLIPTTASLQEDLGASTLWPGTYFVDAVDGITVVVGANTITVINDSPLAFAAGAVNGPDLVFSGLHIAGASIDPTSAADFLGTVATTPDSIRIDYAGLLPALGHAEVIDVSSTVPEPASVLLLLPALAGLAWAQQRHRRTSGQPAAV